MGIIIGIAAIAAWLTHVITCLGVGAWGYLVAGAIFFPVAIIHGVMIWLGMGVVQ